MEGRDQRRGKRNKTIIETQERTRRKNKKEIPTTIVAREIPAKLFKITRPMDNCQS